MTHQEILAQLDRMAADAKHAEQVIRLRQLDGTTPDQVALHDALRSAIGLKRALWRATEALSPTAASA